MKILLLSHIFYPAIDGGSQFVADIARLLSPDRRSLLVITSDCQSTDDFIRPHRPPSIRSGFPFPVFRLSVYTRLFRPIKFLSKIFSPFPALASFLTVISKGPFFKPAPFLRATGKIGNFHPDLIICGPLPTAILIYAHFLKRLLSIIYRQNPKIIVCPCLHPNDPSFTLPVFTNLLQKSDLILALTKPEKTYYLKNLHLPPQKLLLIGGAIRRCLGSSLPPPLPTTPNLLYLGSFSAHKNVETLIQAYCHLQRKFPSLRLTLAGKKTLYLPIILQKISSLPAPCRQGITIKTSFPTHQLSLLHRSSTIFVMPSSQESLSLASLHSLAFGRPIVVSSIPALKELVKKTKAGLVFRTGDHRDLSVKIDSLLSRPKLYRRLAQNGCRSVKKDYTWDRIGKKLCQKLSSLS